MANQTGVGPQLPPDSTGKVTGAFPVTIGQGANAQTIYVPTTILVNTDGYEIGQALLDGIRETNELLQKALTALALIAGEIAGVHTDDLLVEANPI